MTHEYTLLLGATVLPGGGRAACEALAWAGGTILALGSDAEIRAISRGDSQVLEAAGAFVVPLSDPIEVGDPADLRVLGADPRLADPGEPLAVIRSGHVVEGRLGAASGTGGHSGVAGRAT
jgi:predicted amidohydrolase YtcJ